MLVDKILVYHLISLDHVIEGTCDFMDGTSSWYVTLAKFDGRKHRGSGDITVSVCHLI